MSRGYWRYIIAAVGLVAAFSLSALWLYEHDNPKAQKSASGENAQPAKQILPPAIDRIAGALEAIEKEESSHESVEHARRDLDAQEGAWRWTKWAAFAAGWQLVLTVIGFFFVIQSLRQGIAAERPYVRAFRTEKTFNRHGRLISVKGITFRNYGRTPALIKSLAIEFKLAETPPRPRDCTLVRQYPAGQLMVSDEEWPRKHWISPLKGQPKLDSLWPRGIL